MRHGAAQAVLTPDVAASETPPKFLGSARAGSVVPGPSGRHPTTTGPPGAKRSIPRWARMLRRCRERSQPGRGRMGHPVCKRFTLREKPAPAAHLHGAKPRQVCAGPPAVELAAGTNGEGDPAWQPIRHGHARHPQGSTAWPSAKPSRCAARRNWSSSRFSASAGWACSPQLHSAGTPVSAGAGSSRSSTSAVSLTGDDRIRWSPSVDSRAITAEPRITPRTSFARHRCSCKGEAPLCSMRLPLLPRQR